MSGEGEAERYRRLEREWQDEHGQELLERPWEAPGAAAVMQRQLSRIIEDLDLESGGVVLEVGCGRGHLLRKVHEAAGRSGPLLVGLDISQAISALPAKGLIGIQGDGERLPIRDGSVRAVIFDGALHHLIDYRSALREADRVLEPGGRVIILEPVTSRFTRLVHRLADRSAFSGCESPIDLRYKGLFQESVVVDELRRQEMAIERRRTDFLAYPLTGCYAGSVFGRMTGLMKALLLVERAIAALPVLGGIAEIFSWRFFIVATKRRPLAAGPA